MIIIFVKIFDIFHVAVIYYLGIVINTLKVSQNHLSDHPFKTFSDSDYEALLLANNSRNIVVA